MMVIPRTVVDTEQLSAWSADLRQGTEKQPEYFRKRVEISFRLKTRIFNQKEIRFNVNDAT